MTRGQETGQEQGRKGDLRDLAEEFGLVALAQVPGGDGEHHEGAGHGGDDRMREAIITVLLVSTAQIEVSWALPSTIL